ncbi:hypothetical protein H072_9691 [Dactylellina haptotyla CBS 200.50]|uniref:Cofilin n=1 Tax=Dactylellina haptotyla (strain CBS 200.50) TaxID=1284197 RepID=S8A1Y5_DACHA|nr:hypothetical protein H072_9691 [Dactylellina haptotyla CBS 200.50]
MAFGIGLSEDCVPAFNELQPNGPYKYVIYRINDHNTEVFVLKKAESGTYADFLAELPDDICRFGAYSFQGEIESEWNKSLFVHWDPPTARPDHRAVYEEGKISLYRELMGIGAHMMATTKKELAEDIVREEMISNAK